MRWFRLALVHLADRALRARRAARLRLRAHALIRPVADALLAAARASAPAARPDRGSAPDAPRQLEQVLDAAPADAIDAARARARHHLPLARKRRVRDLPALADLADAVRRRARRASVEEHLVEVDLAADVAQRPNLDAGLVQVEQEVRDALRASARRDRCARAGRRSRRSAPRCSTPSGRSRSTIAVALGPRRERREVGARRPAR